MNPRVDLHRLEQTRADADELIAALDAVLTEIDVPSIAAIESAAPRTAVERAAYLSALDDARHEIVAELAELRSRLDTLSRAFSEQRDLIEDAVKRRSFGPELVSRLRVPGDGDDEEAGVLKTKIRELSALHAELTRVRSRLASDSGAADRVSTLIYREGFTAEAFLALAQRVWPRAYSLSDATAALARTTNLGAWDGTRLVGSVRVLTDGYFFATVPEILVDPDYQRRGIGRRLMELALERAPRGKLAFAAQPESVGFFERIGCRRTLTGFVASLPLASVAGEARLTGVTVAAGQHAGVATRENSEGPAFTIRDFRDDDAAAVRELIIELQEHERGLDDRLRRGEDMAADYYDYMLGRCRDHAGEIIVAESHGRVTGFATVLMRVPYKGLDDPPGEFASVSDLAVREQHRRRGIGTALLREAERRARAAGAAELRIGVLAGNRGAAGLYRRLGFVPYLETLSRRFDAPQG